MVESGFDGFVTASVNFIVAPPGTPMPLRQRLSEAADRLIALYEARGKPDEAAKWREERQALQQTEPPKGSVKK